MEPESTTTEALQDPFCPVTCLSEVANLHAVISPSYDVDFLDAVRPALVFLLLFRVVLVFMNMTRSLGLSLIPLSIDSVWIFCD